MLGRASSSVHYDAVECFLRLERLDAASVRAVMSARMGEGSVAERVDGYRRFALLWKIAGEAKGDAQAGVRPFTSALFMMLDTLQHEHPDIRLTGRSWLADNADKAERILDPLLLEALDHIVPYMKTVCESYASADLVRQLPVLLGGMAVYALEVWLAYRKSAARFEKVDL